MVSSDKELPPVIVDYQTERNSIGEQPVGSSVKDYIELGWPLGGPVRDYLE